jgi:hypothetical protein
MPFGPLVGRSDGAFAQAVGDAGGSRSIVGQHVGCVEFTSAAFTASSTKSNRPLARIESDFDRLRMPSNM